MKWVMLWSVLALMAWGFMIAAVLGVFNKNEVATLPAYTEPVYTTNAPTPTVERRIIYIDPTEEPQQQAPTQQAQQSRAQTYVESKIHCSYSSGEYSYDYGMQYPDVCRMKADTYFAQKRIRVNDYRAGSYTPDPINVQFHDKPPAPTVPAGYGYN